MRKLLIVLLLPIWSSALAQSWCPPGAQWQHGFESNSSIGYFDYTYTGDTLIDGALAQRIVDSIHVYHYNSQQFHHNLWSTFHTKLDNEVLYIQKVGQFTQTYWDTLIWYGAVPGDHWEVLQPEDYFCPCDYVVTDTGQVVIDGMLLRRIVTTTTDCSGPGVDEYVFYERIGAMYDLLGQLECAPISDTTLRCYSDQDISYSTGIVQSFDVILGVQEFFVPNPMVLSIWPNPSRGMLQLELPPEYKDGYLIVRDAIGKEVRDLALKGRRGTVQMSVQGLPKGVYLVELLDKKNNRWHGSWLNEGP